MIKNAFSIKASKANIFFVLSSMVFIYWVIANIIDVYRIAVIGAIFEFLWLPMVCGLIIIPLLAIIFWRQEKFNRKSLYLYSLIISIATILSVVITNWHQNIS